MIFKCCPLCNHFPVFLPRGGCPCVQQWHFLPSNLLLWKFVFSGCLCLCSLVWNRPDIEIYPVVWMDENNLMLYLSYLHFNKDQSVNLETISLCLKVFMSTIHLFFRNSCKAPNSRSFRSKILMGKFQVPVNLTHGEICWSRGGSFSSLSSSNSGTVAWGDFCNFSPFPEVLLRSGSLMSSQSSTESFLRHDNKEDITMLSDNWPDSYWLLGWESASYAWALCR